MRQKPFCKTIFDLLPHRYRRYSDRCRRESKYARNEEIVCEDRGPQIACLDRCSALCVAFALFS